MLFSVGLGRTDRRRASRAALGCLSMSGRVVSRSAHWRDLLFCAKRLFVAAIGRRSPRRATAPRGASWIAAASRLSWRGEAPVSSPQQWRARANMTGGFQSASTPENPDSLRPFSEAWRVVAASRRPRAAHRAAPVSSCAGAAHHFAGRKNQMSESQSVSRKPPRTGACYS
jgi:hypothetical protein